MGIRKIVTLGDDTLRKHCKPQEKFDRRLTTLLKDMAETMYKAEGVGLAAPQVGILRRVAVIDVTEDHSGLLELINPVITKKEGSRIACEGCLSVPNFEGEVERAEYVECEYTDPHGKKQFIAADGLMAVCLQHETDHLDGILFTDKAVTITLKAPED